MSDTTIATPPIRLGMVGGGQGAFIGAVHRLAFRMDGQYQLVAGAFSSTPEKSLASGLELGIEESRCYPDFKTMAIAEKKRPDGIEAVVIVTPNHMHFEPIKTFLEAGIHVFCDKPITATLAEAEQLQSVVENASVYFVLTHNYTANPLMRQARAMVQNGDLGDIRVLQGEYVQGWLSTEFEKENKQAAWRTDPKQAGAGAIGDIGSHTYQLLCYVSGLHVTGLHANLTSFVAGRQVDDDAQVLLEFSKGAKGMLWATQVVESGENALKMRIAGTKGALEWEQENPNIMWFTPAGKPKQVLTRAGAGADDASNAVIRTPSGHPEGYLEAFANLYNDMAPLLKTARSGNKMPVPDYMPGYGDGLAGMRFIDACIKSSQSKQWIYF